MSDCNHSELLRGTLRASGGAVAPCLNLLKAVVVSTDADFRQEWQQLTEVVVPELQYHFRDAGLQVQLVDARRCYNNPVALSDLRQEIRACHSISKGCFVIILVGDKVGPLSLPRKLEVKLFQQLRDKAKKNGEDISVLDELYQRDDNEVPAAHVLLASAFQDEKKDPDETTEQPEEWRQKIEQLQRLICHAEDGLPGTSITPSVVQFLSNYALSQSHDAPENILCYIRDFEGIDASVPDADIFVDILDGKVDETKRQQMEDFKHSLVKSFADTNNLVRMSVHWENGIDVSCANHRSYLSSFSQTVLDHMKSLVKHNLQSEPTIKEMGRLAFETYSETLTHLVHCQKQLVGVNVQEHSTLRKIKERIVASHKGSITKDTPIVLTGADGCGKTTLLSAAMMSVQAWLDCDVIKVIRFLGVSPRNMYMAEMLRGLCFHISLALGLEILPRHKSYEWSRLCSWFQELMLTIEKQETPFFLFLDDLHMLKMSPPHVIDSSGGALAWLPDKLPANVHVICTMTSSPAGSHLALTNADRILGTWKPRLESSDCLMDVDPLSDKDIEKLVNYVLKDNSRTLTSKQMSCLKEWCSPHRSSALVCVLLAYDSLTWTSRDNPQDCGFESLGMAIVHSFSRLEERFGRPLIAQIGQFLTCTRYGITETELEDLLGRGDDTFLLRHAMGPLVMERYTDNKLLISWRHRCILEVAKQRYFPSQKAKRSVHSEMANLFLLGFLTEREDSLSSSVDLSLLSGLRSDIRGYKMSAQLSGSSFPWSNVRQIEELWFHLLHTGDVNRIKQITMCNFEFLQSAVRSASICYVLSILELVRTQILDLELEVVYQALKLSIDVLSKEPLQLASEIISWLRPFAESSFENVEALVTQAMEWCDSYTQPLLVPLTSWLWTPLPQQAITLCCPLGVENITITHDNQYVICTTNERVIHMFHVASRQLVRTFTGHRGKVLCVHVEQTGQYLVSGSEDTSVIVWDLVTASPYRTVSEHFASVTCVATNSSKGLVISGSDDSRVILVALSSGDVVQKLEHHRGAISCVLVTDSDDVLLTGSNDSTVCVWSLDDFSLLNTIQLVSPVMHMDLSSDSTFLLVACEDNYLYLRSLATGSEVHAIRGPTANVTQVQIGSDTCRAIVGCADNKVYIYDIHTTKLLYTLNGHNAPVTGIRVSLEDSFLFSGGGDRILVWYFDRNRPQHGRSIDGLHCCARKPHSSGHRDHVTCIDISKDGHWALSGSKDGLVKIWHLAQNELHSTLDGHSGPVTCVCFAPNGIYAVSGSDDRTIRVWGLTLALIVSEFKEHQSRITAAKVLEDSRRVLSADASGMLKLWQADNGTVLLSCLGPTAFLDVTQSMRFAVCGQGDNSLRIWTLSHEDHKFTVNHSDVILCYAVTHDSKFVITGSRDTSLKVWDITVGRLTQVLVGHSGPVTCVAVAPYNNTLVLSGSSDTKLITWNRLTGHEAHMLTGHQAPVTCACLTADAKTAISGSRDMTLRVWDTSTGVQLNSFDLHVPVIQLLISYNASHVITVLENCNQLPLLCLHNHPVVTVTEPPPLSAEERIESSWSDIPMRKMPPRPLHKEMSLDTYTWQKKYGSLTGPKRSSTISLEDFTAVGGGASPPWAPHKSYTMTPPCSVMDVRTDSPDLAVAPWEAEDEPTPPPMDNPGISKSSVCVLL